MAVDDGVVHDQVWRQAGIDSFSQPIFLESQEKWLPGEESTRIKG